MKSLEKDNPENRIMFRGVRLRDFQLENLQKDGMSHCWTDPSKAIAEIYRALEKFHKISKLGRSYILRDKILEIARPTRSQIWCTQDKYNAISYARACPEIISDTLFYAGVDTTRVQKYLQEHFGNPYVITFEAPEPTFGINTVIGRHVPIENIISIEEIDMKKPDPYFAAHNWTKKIELTEEELLAL